MMDELKDEYTQAMIKANYTLGFFQKEMAKVNVYVVTPGETTSLVYLNDNSRFFAEINEDDIVVGGYYG